MKKLLFLLLCCALPGFSQTATIPSTSRTNTWTADQTFSNVIINGTCTGVGCGGGGSVNGTAISPSKVTTDDLITKAPIADVRAFNATCNGTADDTAAFQAAINYLGANGGRIRIPNNCKVDATSLTFPYFSTHPEWRDWLSLELEGTLKVTSTLILQPGVSLRGFSGGFAGGVQFQSSSVGTVTPVGSVSPVIRLWSTSKIRDIQLGACPTDGFSVTPTTGQGALVELDHINAFCPDGNALKIDSSFWVWMRDSRLLTTNGKSIYITDSTTSGLTGQSGLIFFYDTIISSKGIYIDSPRTGTNTICNVFIHGLHAESLTDNFLNVDTSHATCDTLELDGVAFSDTVNLPYMVNHTGGGTISRLRIYNGASGSTALINDASHITDLVIDSQKNSTNLPLSAGGYTNLSPQFDADWIGREWVWPKFQPFAFLNTHQDWTSWGASSGGNITATTTLAPDGTATAATVTPINSANSGVYVDMADPGTASGDYLIFGAWMRTTDSRWRVSLVEFTSGYVTVASANVNPRGDVGSAGWRFATGVLKLVSGSGISYRLSITHPNGTTVPIDFAQPFVMRVPASAGIPEQDILRWARFAISGGVSGVGGAGRFYFKGDHALCLGAVCMSAGAGSPEGAVTANIGSVYHRTDGSTNTTLYRKESGTGNTGWVAVSNAGGSGGDAYLANSQTFTGANIFSTTANLITKFVSSNTGYGAITISNPTDPGIIFDVSGVSKWSLGAYDRGAPTNAAIDFSFYNNQTSSDAFYIDGQNNNATFTAAVTIPTLTGTNASFSGYIDKAEQTAPANPAAGSCRFYVDSTTHLFAAKTSSGTSCLPSSGGGMADPGGNGIVKRTALNVTGTAGYADVVALFGSGTCSGYLKSDGTCSTPVLPVTKTAVSGQPLLSYDSTTGAFTQAALTAANVGALASTTVLPANEAGTASNFLTAYNSTTGAWTKARPTCATLSDSGTACTAASTAFLASSTVLPATKTAVAGSPLLSYDATTGAFTQGALTAANVGAVPTSRTVAGKALSADITLACADLSDDGLGCAMSTTAGGDLAGTLPSPTLAAPFKKRSCEIVINGTGTANVLQSGDDTDAANSCYNKIGVTETIVGVYCRSTAGSNTTTVNPVFGASGSGTTILAGALTCGSTNAYSSMSTGCSGGACTISNGALTDGTGINPVMGGTLTGTSIHVLIVYTVPAS